MEVKVVKRLIKKELRKLKKETESMKDNKNYSEADRAHILGLQIAFEECLEMISDEDKKNGK